MICFVLLLLLSTAVRAEDWPQFLGPTRNGIYTGSDLAASWPKAGLPQIWKKDVGQGFAAPVVVQGRLILFHRVGDREVVDGLKAATGEPIWSSGYPHRHRDA